MTFIHDYSTEQERQVFFDSQPKKLYKYRDWKDEWHKRVLNDNELFFSSPIKFNDPFDCALPFKQHPENSDPLVIKENLEKTAIKKYPYLANDPDALAEICAKQLMTILQNPESWFEENWGYKPEELRQRFGVLSLTPHPDNYLMWSHYSDSHKGFCVEFDTRKLVESAGGHFEKVLYGDEIPYFSINDTFPEDLLTKLLFYKSELWKYEDEYRITRIHNPNLTFKFDPACLTGVYFGCKMPYEQIEEIIMILKSKYPWATFHQYELDKTHFKLNKIDIHLL